MTQEMADYFYSLHTLVRMGAGPPDLNTAVLLAQVMRGLADEENQ